MNQPKTRPPLREKYLRLHPNEPPPEWYPPTRAELEYMLDGFFANVSGAPSTGELVALIAPHAGYRYSGQTAAYAYQQLAGDDYRKVIVLGPSHKEDFGAQAVNNDQYFE